YIGLAVARGDFSAGAALYNLDNDNILKARTFALNKKYQNDKTTYEIEFVGELYDLAGNKITEVVNDYSIRHYSQSDLGIYSSGEEILVQINLNNITNLPAGYYVITYVRDRVTKELLNNPSVYAKITADINRTIK
ncbi:MAG: hypothetical protein PHN29_06450, partial [Endomicrobiaceae bacterium]|nr:hypothetical protein [Endomicrobiaceae bacterium]